MSELIYGEEYSCYHQDEYIGRATFTDHPSIGDCFIRLEVHLKRGLEEIAIMPDRWVLRVKEDC